MKYFPLYMFAFLLFSVTNVRVTFFSYISSYTDTKNMIALCQNIKLCNLWDSKYLFIHWGWWMMNDHNSFNYMGVRKPVFILFSTKRKILQILNFHYIISANLKDVWCEFVNYRKIIRQQFDRYAEKISSLSSARKFFPSESIIYKSTIRHCIDYCCYILPSDPIIYLEILDKVPQKGL